MLFDDASPRLYYRLILRNFKCLSGLGGEEVLLKSVQLCDDVLTDRELHLELAALIVQVSPVVFHVLLLKRHLNAKFVLDSLQSFFGDLRAGVLAHRIKVSLLLITQLLTCLLSQRLLLALLDSLTLRVEMVTVQTHRIIRIFVAGSNSHIVRGLTQPVQILVVGKLVGKLFHFIILLCVLGAFYIDSLLAKQLFFCVNF